MCKTTNAHDRSAHPERVVLVRPISTRILSSRWTRLSADLGAGLGATVEDPSHAQTRRLVELGRDRVERAERPVPERAHAGPGDPPPGSRCLGMGRNRSGPYINRQFSTDAARIKLRIICILSAMNMQFPTKPPLGLSFVWHTGYTEGESLAGQLQDHFESERFRNVTAGLGVPTRNHKLGSGPNKTRPIDWDGTDMTAIIILINRDLINDSESFQYVDGVFAEAESRGLTALAVPVMTDGSIPDGRFRRQALRWYEWDESSEPRVQRLIRELLYEFTRMLRHRLAQLKNVGKQDDLDGYLKALNIFLSHSKHDNEGKTIADYVRKWIQKNTALSSFIDTYNIPSGLEFDDVILHKVRSGGLLAIHTDSYSSREWCRREVLEAKRSNVPMIVIDCLSEMDERSFPYLGNAPTIRVSKRQLKRRIPLVIMQLLGEIFSDYLWQCRTEAFRKTYPKTCFLSRPPELALLSVLCNIENRYEESIVYPDPPLMSDELRLFGEIRPDLTLHTFKQWQGGISP